MNAPLHHLHKVELQTRDYKDDITPFWCPGCGHHGVLTGVFKALADLGVDPTYLVNISGIGCSSRLPYFVRSYRMHTLHGRAGPVATGTHLARPELPILITGGDGDAFSIGGGHMPHLARKNPNLTYVMMDNHIFGLTKGQVSPTSRRKMKAYTTPYGGTEEPLDPVLYMLSYGASFVAQSNATNVKLTASLIKQGMEHRGFAFINVLSNCPSFNDIDDAKYFKSVCEEIPADHDVSDRDAAMHLVNTATRAGKTPVGLLYKVERTTLDERMAALVSHVGGHKNYDLRKIIDLSRP